MAESKTYDRTWSVMGMFAQGKGALRIPKELFLSYCPNVPLISMTQSVPFRDWPKLEGFSGVMGDNNSLWRMVVSNRVQTCSKKAWFYSREVGSDGCLQVRVSIT